MLQMLTMRHLVVVVVVMLVGQILAEEMEEMEAVTTQAPEILEFSLEINHLASSVSSIELSWKALVPDSIRVERYRITAVKNGSEAVTTGPPLKPTRTGYVVEDLVADSMYHVCVMVTLVNTTSLIVEGAEGVEEEYRQCVHVATIPYILENSLYVLCGTIGFILFLVLVGFITWRCAMCHAEQAERKKDKGEGSGDAEKGEEAPFLASSSTKQEPEIRKVFRPNPVDA